MLQLTILMIKSNLWHLIKLNELRLFFIAIVEILFRNLRTVAHH